MSSFKDGKEYILEMFGLGENKNKIVCKIDAVYNSKKNAFYFSNGKFSYPVNNKRICKINAK